MAKLNLDALIIREVFEAKDCERQDADPSQAKVSISDLKDNDGWFPILRKPDFQRETNEWKDDRVCDFIGSFLNGDFIPAIILWKNPSGYIFVVDGAHRLSSLLAWIYDDYGDGEISGKFYKGAIPKDQRRAAQRMRESVNKKISAYRDYLKLANSPSNDPNVTKARKMRTRSIDLQWITGDIQNAERSFFKINQQAAPLDSTEIRLLEGRKKPNSIAARAILRSGTSAQYWQGFPQKIQDTIKELSGKIYEILFEPELYKSTITSIELPIGGKIYSHQARQLVLDFVNLANNIENEKELEADDSNGSNTVKFLQNTLKLSQRLNSNHPSSLGLHPVIYFYTRDGRYKMGAFLAMASFIQDIENKKHVSAFINSRKLFEDMLFQHEYLHRQIVQKYKFVSKAIPHIKDFYNLLIDSNVKSVEQCIDKMKTSKKFGYLKFEHVYEEAKKNSFSKSTKSARAIEEMMRGAPLCQHCGGKIHTNSVSTDHIIRKQDGGGGELENAQLMHPFCNSAMKN